MKTYKRSIPAIFFVVFMVVLLLSGCSIETPSVEDEFGGSDDTDTTTAPSIETEIIGTWQLAAVWVHGDSRQEYISDTYLTFSPDGTVELSDKNYEEALVYTGTYYVEDGIIYTDYISVNQESYEVSPENMNGEITLDSEAGELIYNYINDSNGLTWYFVKK